MKKQTIFALLIVITLGCFAAASCSSIQNAIGSKPAAITQLSGEELSLVLPRLAPPQALAQLAGNTAQIEVLLKQVKQVLALAAEARKNGIADDPAIKQQLDFTASQVLAIEFDKDQNKNAADAPPAAGPFASVKPEEVEAFMTESGNEAKFNSFVEIIKKQIAEAAPPGVPAQEITADQLKKFREQWAKALITERKARAAGFDQKREIQLQIALQQSSLLAQEYGKRKDKEFDVDDAALNDYIAQHPEFDSTKQREKAEGILARAQKGEDFAKLANEFSEDPGNKNPQTGKPNGGLYEDIKKGQFMPAFETAALDLEKNQISPKLVETPYGYHIIKLEDKKTVKGEDGNEAQTFSVRHILISTAGAPDPSNPFAQPKSMKESARDKIKKEKRDKWIEEVEAKNPITVPKPEEVKIEAPSLPPPPPAGMPNMPPATSGDAPVPAAPSNEEK